MPVDIKRSLQVGFDEALYTPLGHGFNLRGCHGAASGAMIVENRVSRKLWVRVRITYVKAIFRQLLVIQCRARISLEASRLGAQ